MSLILIFLSLESFAQVTTGVWKGELYNNVTKKYQPIQVVVTVEKNGFVKGYSYITYDIDGNQVPVLKRIKIAFHNHDVAFEDMEPLSDDTAFAAFKKNRLSFATAITGSGVALSMNGIWKTLKTDKKNTQTGTLSLSKVDDFTEAEVFKELENLDRTKDLSFVRKKPKRDDVDADLATLDAPVTDIIPVAMNVEKKDIDKDIVVAKKVEVVPIKEAAAIIKEEDKPIVAVVEKKEPPVTNPILAKPEPIVTKVEEKKSVQVAAKPAPEKKITPPIVSKPKEKPNQVAVVKSVPEKKATPVAAITPKPSTPKPIVAAPKTVSPTVAVKIPEPPKKEMPKQVFAPPSGGVAADFMGRKTITQQTVEFQSDSLVLTLYDNGEVDGDTVSVLMNGGVIFSKTGLTTRPNRKTIYISKDMPDTLTLLMYAENLGSIPPNTGLLVVWDADQIYELRFSADLKTNAAIIFRRKKN